MVIRKHCIELDDANKFNAKFQSTTHYNIFQDNKILNGQIPFIIIQNQSLRSWKFDSAAVYFMIYAANKLKSRVFFALTLTLRMTPGR